MDAALGAPAEAQVQHAGRVVMPPGGEREKNNAVGGRDGDGGVPLTETARTIDWLVISQRNCGRG